MITGFEDQTHDLNDYELTVVLPLMVKGLRRKVGEQSAITSTQAITKMKDAGIKVNPARFRKVINHIRIHGLILHLISTSRGYYIATTEPERKKYLDSLRQRIESITAVYDAMEYQFKTIRTEATPEPGMTTERPTSGSTPRTVGSSRSI